ncbi:hypothetical protein [Herbaspirillum sp. RV1423]|uniref:hypothetical protein n=1 Tax=Herbaspirillum sp. RV1423 TaxID=1443993 RepID=UPI0004B9B741|nr:hypothetical protein [Herbaspirillum sp. RV1423]
MFTKATFLYPVADTSFKPTNSKKIMRYPNTRYGNPTEFQYYAQGQLPKDIAKRLRRSEHSVNLWLAGKRRMPWWIPEILRLQRLEYDMWMRQAGLGRMRDKLGTVSADVIEFSGARPPAKPLRPENGHGDSQVA